MDIEIKLGSVTFNQLMDALHIVNRVLSFVAENKDSENPEVRENAHMALMAIAMDDIMRRPIIGALVSEVTRELESEKKDKTARNETISIQVPINRSKS